MLKGFYFALVAAFLAAVLWMINDMRLGVNALVDRLDRQLPPILNNTEQGVKLVDKQLPQILKNSEQAAKDINTHLPQLLKKAQQGVDQLAGLAKSFRDFRDLFASLGAPPRHKDRMRVANDVLSRTEGQLP